MADGLPGMTLLGAREQAASGGGVTGIEVFAQLERFYASDEPVDVVVEELMSTFGQDYGLSGPSAAASAASSSMDMLTPQVEGIRICWDGWWIDLTATPDAQPLRWDDKALITPPALLTEAVVRQITPSSCRRRDRSQSWQR
ncbi:MAG: hypothetical protein ACR2HR_04910 [Euzebya sp.]